MACEILVFLKYPEPGRVKTRLARDIGPAGAAELYRLFVEALLRGLAPLAPVLCYDPAWAEASYVSWLGPAVYRPQRGQDLGERLRDAFQQAGWAAVAIGTDSPQLDAAWLERALDALAQHDAVIGPAGDGGYYLVGARREVPALFSGIGWSSSSVLDQTLRRAATLGLSVALLEETQDVDTLADLRDLARDWLSAPHLRALGPAVRAALRHGRP